MRMISKGLSTLAIILGSVHLGYAATINLYDKPAGDAKVVGSIDPAKGLTIIFTPKNSAFIKVADPSNGNVGWIKQTDIKKGDQVTFTHSIIHDGKGNHSYQVFEFGPGTSKSPDLQVQYQQLSPAQQEELRRFQQQSQQIQDTMNRAIGEMMGAFMQLGQPYQPTDPANASKNNVQPNQNAPLPAPRPGVAPPPPAPNHNGAPLDKPRVAPLPPGTTDMTP